jgi:hypothetical protein
VTGPAAWRCSMTCPTHGQHMRLQHTHQGTRSRGAQCRCGAPVMRASREAKDPASFKDMDAARAHLMSESTGPTLQTFLNWISQGGQIADRLCSLRASVGVQALSCTNVQAATCLMRCRAPQSSAHLTTECYKVTKRSASGATPSSCTSRCSECRGFRQAGARRRVPIPPYAGYALGARAAEPGAHQARLQADTRRYTGSSSRCCCRSTNGRLGRS